MNDKQTARDTWYKRPLYLLTALAVISLLAVAVSGYVLVEGGDFWLKAKNMGKENFIYLEWDDTGTDRFYTLQQSVDGGSSWELRSGNYGKAIKVLNIYPVDGADGLKDWMEADGVDGYGKGLISVDKVLLSAFNADPGYYLKNSQDSYEYDVIVFGFWDSNGGTSKAYDLNDIACDAVEDYIRNGYGVLFGHDTALDHSDTYFHDNFVYLAETYTNIEAYQNSKVPTLGSTKIINVNDGFLTQYPWKIEFNQELTIPLSHSSSHIANGTIWMKFVEPFQLGGPEVLSESGGTSNFYLTTWNNTAMIQTGHTKGTSAESEQKVLANVLMYLAQYTDDTYIEERSASDLAAPGKPEAEWSNLIGQVTISAEDMGTRYWFKVESKNKHDTSDMLISDTVYEDCISGIKGYYIIEDAEDYIDFDETTAVFWPAEADGTLSYTMTDMKNYIHIKAEDWAGDEEQNKPGNIGEAVRVSPYDPGWELTITKHLDQAAVTEQNYLFMIERRLEPAGRVQETYYGIATVPTGSSTAVICFEHILPGIYSITEKKANWTYQLDASTPAEQPIILTDPLNPEGVAEYKNNVVETAWIHGKDGVENVMIKLE